MFVLVPLLCMNFINAITAWVQHAFCDPDNPLDYFANTVTVVDKVNFLNEGYQLCHHHRASLHWTEMPAHFERIRDKMRDAASLVFRDLDFMGLFLELTLFHRMDVLAEKLVPWEPMNHDQKLALLAKRTGLKALESDKSWSGRLAKFAAAREHYDAAKEGHIYAYSQSPHSATQGDGTDS